MTSARISASKHLARLRRVATAACAALMLGSASAEAVSVNEYAPLPHESSLPGGVTAGPDGAVWFTELNSYPFSPGGGRIGRLTPAGTLTEYSLGEEDVPGAITLGPDGNLWFTDAGTDTIGRITPQGSVTKFGGIVDGGNPQDITTGPDGALWFTEGGYNAGNRIGRITTEGVVTEFCIRTCGGSVCVCGGLGPNGIVAGPDGRIWFVMGNREGQDGNPYGDAGVGYIAAATVEGKITEYPLRSRDAQPTDIVVGHDGALWFTQRAANKIGRITTAGSITEFSIPTAHSWPTSIARGPDNALWFIQNMANKVARIDAGGQVSEYGVPTPNANPGGIALGPDFRMYFAETSGNRIGVVTTDFVPGTVPGASGTGAGAPARPGSPASAPAGAAAVKLRVVMRWQRRGRWWRRLLVTGAINSAATGRAASGCGRAGVEVRLRRGGRALAVRRVRASGRCRFSATFAVSRAVSTHRRPLMLAVRFHGAAGLKPQSHVSRVVRPPRGWR